MDKGWSLGPALTSAESYKDYPGPHVKSRGTYINETADPSVVEESFNKCIMHYRLPRDIQGHANNIGQRTNRIATNLEEAKGGVLMEIGVGNGGGVKGNCEKKSWNAW